MHARIDMPTTVVRMARTVTDQGPRGRCCRRERRRDGILSGDGVVPSPPCGSFGSWMPFVMMSVRRDGGGGRQAPGESGMEVCACLPLGEMNAWFCFQLKLAGLLLLAGEGLADGCCFVDRAVASAFGSPVATDRYGDVSSASSLEPDERPFIGDGQPRSRVSERARDAAAMVGGLEGG